MSMSDLEKIEQLFKNATNPRQRAMAKSLLNKINEPENKTLSADAPDAAPTGTQPQTSEVLTTKELEDAPSNNPVFQAIGVIQGEVNLGEDGTNTVTIKGKKYRLKYASEKRKTLFALKLEIKRTGNNFQRLIVYPRVVHFPRRDQPQAIYFELVGFSGSSVQSKGIINDLNDLEFKLSGLWQFIPVCRVPCISVFRNFSESRKLFIKEAEPLVKVRFMKAAHLPLLWKDSPVIPFRFNPKLGKEEQGRTMFVQVKAKFIPQRDTFGFVEQLAEPLEESPRFLKASKEDKAEQRKNVAPPMTPKQTLKQPVDKPKLARTIKAGQ